MGIVCRTAAEQNPSTHDDLPHRLHSAPLPCFEIKSWRRRRSLYPRLAVIIIIIISIQITNTSVFSGSLLFSTATAVLHPNKFISTVLIGYFDFELMKHTAFSARPFSSFHLFVIIIIYPFVCSNIVFICTKIANAAPVNDRYDADQPNAECIISFKCTLFAATIEVVNVPVFSHDKSTPQRRVCSNCESTLRRLPINHRISNSRHTFHQYYWTIEQQQQQHIITGIAWICVVKW